jgi:hypothetical protein
MPKIAVNIPCECVATFEAFDLLNYRLPPSLAVRVRASAGAIKVLAESKLRVPEDVVIVGYDRRPANCGRHHQGGKIGGSEVGGQKQKRCFLRSPV